MMVGVVYASVGVCDSDMSMDVLHMLGPTFYQ